jgi:hypothetical protein
MTIAGVVAESFAKAETYLLQLADLDVSSQRIRRITRQHGRERIKLRNQVTEYHKNQKLTDKQRRIPDGVTAPAIAAISFDGGRYQLLDRSADGNAKRAEARRGGKHRKGQHWKESRVACVMSMKGETYTSDPMPQLPEFLAGGSELCRKLTEIGRIIKQPESATDTSLERDGKSAAPESVKKSPRRSRKKPLAADRRPLPGPDLVHRDCIASAAVWRDFADIVAAEAWSRGFAGALRKVCVCDGNDAIRRVCETQFSDYVHVLDLMHALSYSMSASRGVGGTLQEINDRYRRWAELIWSGKVDRVITELAEHGEALGAPPADASTDDPREAVRAAQVYYTNQRTRMDYPRYRLLGLPLTTSLMESAVKQVGRRVKGTEKFWSAGGGDELLALRGDYISDDNRLGTFLNQFARPNDGMRAYATAA